MPEFSNTIISLFQSRAAPDQGGLLNGKDPSAYNPEDPLRVWIIQVGLIITVASSLSLLLHKVKQPKVIAEVLGGILLGPTAFGRIPGFTEHIFPPQSKPYLSLTANIGLCLFLFLVGLEIDASIIKRNARLSVTVALAGMLLPFGLGAGVSVPIYKHFIDQTVHFTYFMLFAGVAFSITAFPVLCRILTELKLLDTTVGIVVLSAGVGNDIVGWTLLALSVALVNAGSGLTALYILLVCVAWTVFLLVVVKRAMKWLARKTGSIENGPTVFFMTVVILFTFGSAFFTDVIGVHAIFGAFLAGLVVPREGGLAIALTEKLEDMTSIIFLPLYFTLSGLSTDLGLLNNGITWAYTVIIIALAFLGKFCGCMLAAKYLAQFSWREAGTIGALMSCKGLVELIVLNVGLAAGILSQRVFSMFVLEALVLTCMTTPLVTVLYPPHVRKRASAGHGDHAEDHEAKGPGRKSLQAGLAKTRFTVVLDKLEHLPGMMALTQLIQHQSPEPAPVTVPQSLAIHSGSRPSTGMTSMSNATLSKASSVSVEALRLIELSDRVSAVMKSSATDFIMHTDPVLSIFRMFAQLNDIPISPSLSIVPFDDLSYSVAEHARNYDSDMIMVPWLPPHIDSPDGFFDAHQQQQTPPTPKHVTSYNPFDLLFRSTSTSVEKSASVIHSQFVRGVFMRAKTDVALFVDQSPPDVVITGGSRQHVFLPFFGGPDDRLALQFVVQICENPKVTATVMRITKRDGTVVEPPKEGKEELTVAADTANGLTVTSVVTGFPDTVYGYANTETRLQSETADNVAWVQYTQQKKEQGSNSQAALSRIEFRELFTPTPLHSAIAEASIRRADGDGETKEVAEADAGASTRSKGGREAKDGRAPLGSNRLLVMTGRSRRLAVENHSKELKQLMEEYGNVGAEVKKTIGDVAAAFVVAGCGHGVVVVQAAHEV
ncbi:hypothetical protein AX17_006806 [Amanita inopinata Kibby_2008]|nr:hypothetical protein AX17_006806 [Amanita inopinata Kibby_2008]